MPGLPRLETGSRQRKCCHPQRPRKAGGRDALPATMPRQSPAGPERYPVMNGNPAHPLVQMITAYRRSIGVTQEQVAKTMGTRQSAISDMELGVTQPQLSTLIRYADALGLRIVWGIAGIDVDRLWLNKA